MPEMIESTTIASKYRATLQKPRNCNGSIEFKLRHWEAGGIEGLCLLFELIEIQVSLWIAKVSRFYGTSIFPIPLWHGIRRKAHCSEKSIWMEFSSFAIFVVWLSDQSRSKSFSVWKKVNILLYNELSSHSIQHGSLFKLASLDFRIPEMDTAHRIVLSIALSLFNQKYWPLLNQISYL